VIGNGQRGEYMPASTAGHNHHPTAIS